MILTGRTEALRVTHTTAASSATSLIRTGLGSDPGLRGERQVTNRLSYFT